MKPRAHLDGIAAIYENAEQQKSRCGQPQPQPHFVLRAGLQRQIAAMRPRDHARQAQAQAMPINASVVRHITAKKAIEQALTRLR